MIGLESKFTQINAKFDKIDAKIDRKFEVADGSFNIWLWVQPYSKEELMLRLHITGMN